MSMPSPNPQQTANRLRALAADMCDIAIDLDSHATIDEAWHYHAAQLAGAGKIALQWAQNLSANPAERTTP